MNISSSVYSSARKCKLAMWFIVFIDVASASSQGDINAFLLGAHEDTRVLNSQDKWRGAGTMKSNAIPLEDVEFRADMDDKGYSSGDYLFRFNLGSFSESRALSARLQANETMYETRYNVVLSEALHKRYRQYLSVMGLDNKLTLSMRRIALFEEKVSAYKNFSDSPEFSFMTLMDAEQDLAEERLNQMRLQRDRNVAAVMLREYGSVSESSLNDSWLKSVEEVMQLFDDSTPLEAPASGSPLLARTDSAVLAAEKQLDWQRTKDDVSLKFLDVGYNKGNESYTVGVAVKFPLGAKTDRAVVKARTRLNAARREQLLLQQELPQQLHQAQQNIQELHEAYRLVVKRLQENSRSESTLSVSDPLIMFRIIENTLHWKLEEAVIRQKILEQYVDILHRSGQLAAQPLKNYLSKNEDRL